MEKYMEIKKTNHKLPNKRAPSNISQKLLRVLTRTRPKRGFERLSQDKLIASGVRVNQFAVTVKRTSNLMIINRHNQLYLYSDLHKEYSFHIGTYQPIGKHLDWA